MGLISWYNRVVENTPNHAHFLVEAYLALGNMRQGSALITRVADTLRMWMLTGKIHLHVVEFVKNNPDDDLFTVMLLAMSSNGGKVTTMREYKRVEDKIVRGIERVNFFNL